MRHIMMSYTPFFRISEIHSAFRKWSVTHTQGSMALTELCELVSLQTGEEPANQWRRLRIECDNADMNAVTNTLKQHT